MTLENLNEREKAIMAELDSIRKIKALVEDDATLQLLRQVLANGVKPEPSAQVPTIQIVEEPKKQHRLGYHQGARKEVLLALMTGPASDKELARAFGWTEAKCHGVTQPMERAHLVLFTDGKYALTGQGKAQATWFLKHPSYSMYHRGVA